MSSLPEDEWDIQQHDREFFNEEQHLAAMQPLPAAIADPKLSTSTGVGAKCSVKNLYEGPQNPHAPPNVIGWVEEYPEDVEESVECKVESQQHALLVRNRKNRGGRRPLAIHSIDIQSPLLKRALEYVFDGYPGITPGLGHLSFAPPFKAFFHRWDRLQKMAADEDNQDQETRAHVQLLKKVLEGELEETFDTHNDLLSHGVMKFEFLWTLFKPGDLIFTNQGGQDRVEKVQDSNLTQTPRGLAFEIAGYHVDCDGKRFGYEFLRVPLHIFAGTKPITELAAYPLHFHASVQKLQNRLIHRGQLFEQLRGIHYKHYKEPGQESNKRLPATETKNEHSGVSISLTRII
jgi:hypothetical protein